MRPRGFSLVECLVGTALSLFVACAALEFLVSAQKHFFKLKARTEASQSALAALDKIRVDLLHAGRGLHGPEAAGLVEAVRATGEELRLTSLDSALTLASEARAGDLRLSLTSTTGVSAGRELCLFDGLAGEVRTVVRVEPQALVLGEPLGSGYSPGTAAVLLLERVAYFVDGPAGILRRRVNGGSAQPLLEDTANAEWRYDGPEAGLARVRLELKVEGVNAHGMSVFIKNAALARAK